MQMRNLDSKTRPPGFVVSNSICTVRLRRLFRQHRSFASFRARSRHAMTGSGQSRPQRRTTSLSGPDATARVSCSAGVASSMRLGYGVSVHTYAKEPSSCRSQAPPVAHGRGFHLGDSLQKAPGGLPLGCNDMDATRIGGIAELAHRGLQGCSHG